VAGAARRARWGAILVGLTVLAGAAETARAQDPDDEITEARVAFEAGRAALESGDLPGAVEALERSLTLHPTAATAWNLAVARARAGDDVGAAELAAHLARGTYGPLPEGQRAQAGALLGELAERVGRLRIRVTGAAAPWLLVDGARQPLAPDGSRLIFLAPGDHTVVVGAAGVRERRFDGHWARGEAREVAVDLAGPTRGRLRVTSTEGEPVEVLGVRQAPSPLELELPVGEYQVGIADVPDSRHSVTVQAGSLRDIEVEMPPSRWPKVALAVVGALVLVGGAILLGRVLADEGPTAEEDPVFGTITALRAW